MPLLTQSALLRALGWTLFNSLWQIALLWLCFHLLVRLFRQAPSRSRHGLALVLLAFGALGSMVTFAAAWLGGEGGVASLDGGIQAGRWFVDEALPYCSSAYLIVLGGLLVRYFHQYIESRRMGRTGLSRMPAELRVFVSATGRRMGIRPEVSAYLSTLVDVPMTMGFWKPVILLPVAMMSRLSLQQVEAILVHELAHIRRNDYLINLGVTVVSLLFFFNPFARMLVRQIQKEREHCCDDYVLQFCYDPHDYVSALLSLARQHRQGRLALAANGDGGDQLLLQRARKILQQKRTDRRPGARPFILLFLTAALTILSLARPAGAGEPETVAPVAARPVTALMPGSREIVFVPIANKERGTQNPQQHLRTTKKEGAHKEEITEYFVKVMPQPAAMASAEPGTATLVFTRPAALVRADPPAKRDNSLGKGEATGGDTDDNGDDEDSAPLESLVFVPNNSFSIQHIDTLRPQDKLTLLEENNTKEVMAEVTAMQKELQAQMELLRRQEAQAREISAAAQQQLKELLNKQQQLQKDFQKRLELLNQRMKKTSHKVTVYI